MATNQTSSSPVANDIRDIKPPIEIPNGWEWLWWMLGVIVFLVALILLWRYVHRRMTACRLCRLCPRTFAQSKNSKKHWH
ncbi:MAG: hypothetical protein WDN00_16770 [Limisphaerales bacterium]